MLEPKKDFFAMIHMHVKLVSRNVIFFFKSALLSHTTDFRISFSICFTTFHESPTPVQRFTPGYVYHRRTPPASDPSTDLTEVPPYLRVASDPVLPISYDPPPLCRSSRPHKPPERYGFSTPVAMSTTLSSISIPTCYK
jgi:hypothetical protein